MATKYCWLKRIIISSVFSLLAIYSAYSMKSDSTLPYINTRYLIKYIPVRTSQFLNSNKIFVYYILDYWDSPFDKNIDDKTILSRCKNSKRKKIVQMEKKGKIWEADIPISSNAKILSYIFTDEVSFDLNNEQTYSDYVYNSENVPVRDSHVYMQKLFDLTGKNYSEQLQEISKEFDLYPANFSAKFFYWQLYLYKEEYTQEAKNKIENEIITLYNENYTNPEVWTLLCKSYYNGILKTKKIFDILVTLLDKEIPEDKKSLISQEKYGVSPIPALLQVQNKFANPFTAFTLDGKEITVGNLKGKVSQIFAFAAIERGEYLLNLMQIIKKRSDKNNNPDLQYITLLLPEKNVQHYAKSKSKVVTYKEINRENIRKILEPEKFSFPIYFVDSVFISNYHPDYFNVYLIDREGIIKYYYSLTHPSVYEEADKKAIELLNIK